jgi:hypothetical protein
MKMSHHSDATKFVCNLMFKTVHNLLSSLFSRQVPQCASQADVRHWADLPPHHPSAGEEVAVSSTVAKQRSLSGHVDFTDVIDRFGSK